MSIPQVDVRTIIMAMPFPIEPIINSSETVPGEQSSRVFSALSWTSFAFAILQSVCTVLVGLGGARLLISVLSLAAASSVFTHMDAFHRDGLRIPMMLFASVGAILNLIVVGQVRRLRSRSSSSWRQNVASQARKIRQELWQIILSIVTLALVVCEEIFHHLHLHLW